MSEEYAIPVLPPQLNNLVEEALAELENKSKKEIDYETALRWAARAIAAFSISARSENGLEAYADGIDYFHEALEHAATSMNLREAEMIKKSVEPFRWGAHQLLENKNDSY